MAYIAIETDTSLNDLLDGTPQTLIVFHNSDIPAMVSSPSHISHVEHFTYFMFHMITCVSKFGK